MTALWYSRTFLTDAYGIPDFLNNVFNMPGTPNPNGTSGLISTQGSYSAPRTLQLTGRLTF